MFGWLVWFVDLWSCLLLILTLFSIEEKAGESSAAPVPKSGALTTKEEIKVFYIKIDKISVLLLVFT